MMEYTVYKQRTRKKKQHRNGKKNITAIIHFYSDELNSNKHTNIIMFEKK
jgi:hypothetical protein